MASFGHGQVASHFRVVRPENRFVAGRVRGLRNRLSQRSGFRYRRHRNIIQRLDIRHFRLQTQRLASFQAEMPLPGTAGTIISLLLQ